MHIHKTQNIIFIFFLSTCLRDCAIPTIHIHDPCVIPTPCLPHTPSRFHTFFLSHTPSLSLSFSQRDALAARVSELESELLRLQQQLQQQQQQLQQHQQLASAAEFAHHESTVQQLSAAMAELERIRHVVCAGMKYVGAKNPRW